MWVYLCTLRPAVLIRASTWLRAPPHAVSSSWVASRAFDGAIPATALFFRHFKTCAFPYNFKSNYVYVTRHVTGILIGIALNTKISERGRIWRPHRVKFSGP